MAEVIATDVSGRPFASRGGICDRRRKRDSPGAFGDARRRALGGVPGPTNAGDFSAGVALGLGRSLVAVSFVQSPRVTKGHIGNVIFREFTNRTQGPFDGLAVVRDSSSFHRHQVERPRVRHDDVLCAACREEMGQPDDIGGLSRGNVSAAAVLSLLASFSEESYRSWNCRLSGSLASVRIRGIDLWGSRDLA